MRRGCWNLKNPWLRTLFNKMLLPHTHISKAVIFFLIKPFNLTKWNVTDRICGHQHIKYTNPFPDTKPQLTWVHQEDENFCVHFTSDARPVVSELNHDRGIDNTLHKHSRYHAISTYCTCSKACTPVWNGLHRHVTQCSLYGRHQPWPHPLHLKTNHIHLISPILCNFKELKDDS